MTIILHSVAKWKVRVTVSLHVPTMCLSVPSVCSAFIPQSKDMQVRLSENCMSVYVWMDVYMYVRPVNSIQIWQKFFNKFSENLRRKIQMNVCSMYDGNTAFMFVSCVNFRKVTIKCDCM